MALDGGWDGLEVIGRFLAQAGTKLKDRGFVMVEIGADQRSGVLALGRKYFPTGKTTLLQDWQGLDRVVIIETD